MRFATTPEVYKALPIVLASFAALLLTRQHVSTSLYYSHFPCGFSPHFSHASGRVSCEFAVPHRNHLSWGCSPNPWDDHWAGSHEILPWCLDLHQEVSWAHGLEFLSSTAMFRAAGLLRSRAQWLSRRDHHGLPRRVMRRGGNTHHGLFQGQPTHNSLFQGHQIFQKRNFFLSCRVIVFKVEMRKFTPTPTLAFVNFRFFSLILDYR